MQKARLTLRMFRSERVKAVREYVGGGWSEQGTPYPVPVNLLALYTQIVGRSLIAKNPRVMLSTFERDQKPTVSKMESWANAEIVRMNLAATLQRIVLDALFSIGIGKVALASPADSSIAGWQTPAGSPFAERVDLDDFVFDVHARSFEEVGFIGHRYRAPLDIIRDDSKTYSAARKDLTAADDAIYNLEGDERIGVMGRGYYSNMEEYDDFVDLWEIYVPRLQAVFTFESDYQSGTVDTGKKPLRVQRWIGPATGPYSILAYGVVPGNAMPKAPIQDLLPLHVAMNQIYRKLLRQADRQKETWAVRGGSVDASGRLAQANDGEMFQCDDPAGIVPIISTGPSAANFQFAGAVKDLFSWIAGNLDSMGGLSPQAKTLGQDQMLAANSSKAIADMQDTTVTFTTRMVSNLCWYWHHHPSKVMKTTYSPPGLPQHSITRKLTPQDRRQIPWSEMDVKIDPYSIQHATPQSRIAALNDVVTKIIIPLAPMLQQQGVMLDMNAYLQKMAHLADMPDLADIVTFQAPPAQEGQPTPTSGGTMPGKPPDTTRTYERISRGGDTANNRDAGRMNAASAGWRGPINPSSNGTQGRG